MRNIVVGGGLVVLVNVFVAACDPQTGDDASAAEADMLVSEGKCDRWTEKISAKIKDKKASINYDEIGICFILPQIDLEKICKDSIGLAGLPSTRRAKYSLCPALAMQAKITCEEDGLSLDVPRSFAEICKSDVKLKCIDWTVNLISKIKSKFSPKESIFPKIGSEEKRQAELKSYCRSAIGLPVLPRTWRVRASCQDFAQRVMDQCRSSNSNIEAEPLWETIEDNFYSYCIFIK